MGVTAKQQPPSFVISAMLAGHLFRMQKTAKLMLLSASNAKGVASRAGDQATGFRPITDFIAEMANDTIQFASNINELSLTVSRTSVAVMRAQDAIRRFRQASSFTTSEKQKCFIDRLITQSTDNCCLLQQENADIMSKLVLQLDEINQRVRGSSIVVSTSRTEASRAGDFQKYLNSIANSVEHAARELQIEITACRKLIDALQRS